MARILPNLETRQIQILRGGIFDCPGSPFSDGNSLRCLEDGGLAISSDKVLACGDYGDVSRQFPGASVRDLRGAFLIPGLVDTHTHFPQIRILGTTGYALLDWLEQIALPEEARMADAAYASGIARDFVDALARNGTTTALVFGAHFPGATAALFDAAEQKGLRISSGLVLSDRNLRPELYQTPDAAYRDSLALIERFHGAGRLSYAVTPRFALSASEAMLEVSGALLRSRANLRFTTHINENRAEVEQTTRAFPWASDYLAVYERYGLVGRRSVLAHNVQASDDEIRRIAAAHASVAHCPNSNDNLGSGIFPMVRHLAANAHFGLGTDVGAGSGFGVMAEAMAASRMQRIAETPFTVTPAMMLYLATRAGAEALGLEDEVGDFSAGNSADFVVLRPPAGIERAETHEQILAALFEHSAIAEVRVANEVVFAE